MAGLAERLLERATHPTCKPPDDPVIERSAPLLWELLTLDVYRDGTLRVLPTLRFERVSGGWVAELQDHASNQKLRVVLVSLRCWWEALEARLRSPEAVWEGFSSYKVRDPSKRVKPKQA